MCANVFLFFKPHEKYDILLGNDDLDIYYNFEDKDQSIHDATKVSRYCKFISYFSLLLYILEINIPKRAVLIFLGFGNLLLTIPELYAPFNRYHLDYAAYINQAA